MGIILSDNCYLRDKCWKFQKNPTAECKFSNVYCPKLFRMDYLFNEALLTQKQRFYIPLRIDEDGTDREEFKQLQLIEQNIEQFVDNGANLYLHSMGSGCGKTSWALRLIQDYLEKIWHKSDLTCRALFINVPRFLQSLKDSISNTNDYADHIRKNILKADLVVFDEIATGGVSKFEYENLLSIINTRIEEGKSNIYTSNLNGEQLNDILGERLYSRIVNLSTDIELHGSDKRSIYS